MDILKLLLDVFIKKKRGNNIYYLHETIYQVKEILMHHLQLKRNKIQLGLGIDSV